MEKVRPMEDGFSMIRLISEGLKEGFERYSGNSERIIGKLREKGVGLDVDELFEVFMSCVVEMNEELNVVQRQRNALLEINLKLLNLVEKSGYKGEFRDVGTAVDQRELEFKEDLEIKRDDERGDLGAILDFVRMGKRGELRTVQGLAVLKSLRNQMAIERRVMAENRELKEKIRRYESIGVDGKGKEGTDGETEGRGDWEREYGEKMNFGNQCDCGITKSGQKGVEVDLCVQSDDLSDEEEDRMKKTPELQKSKAVLLRIEKGLFSLRPMIFCFLFLRVIGAKKRPDAVKAIYRLSVSEKQAIIPLLTHLT